MYWAVGIRIESTIFVGTQRVSGSAETGCRRRSDTRPKPADRRASPSPVHAIVMKSLRLPPIAKILLLLLIGYGTGRYLSPSILQAPASVKAPGASQFRPNAEVSQHPAPTISPSESNGQWEDAWARLTAQPRSPATDETAGAALEALAGRDPARALALALKERNRQRRTGWLHAVLRGWGAVAPIDAARWMATLPSIEQEGAEQAVMDGAARTPGAAIALAQHLVQSDPGDARSHANQLLRVLSHAGDYQAGVDFTVCLPEQIQSELLGTAFQYWAQAQPEHALDAALKLPAGEQRKTALDAAISGWSQGDPSGLAEAALNLSSSTDRAEALQTALREWVQINPKAASDWIDKFDSKPELDAGTAAVALQPDVLSKHPDIAASWAESITDPALRTNTLVSVIREWAAQDFSAALSYAKTSAALQPSERATLLATLEAGVATP